MRFLHLSDLHLGKRVCEFSMLDDQRYILEQILSLLDTHPVDAVLLAGDLYDKPVPPAEAVRLLDWFLTALAERKLPVFAISGNHDSADRIAFGSHLLAESRVYMSPVFTGAPEPIPLTDEYGPVDIYLLPFLKPATVRHVWPEEPAESTQSYSDALGCVLRRCKRDPAHRSLLVAHQFVAGAAVCESEEPSVGGVDSVDAAIAHIAAHSTHHSDAIITENAQTAQRFTQLVDSAAVYVNASTRFTDGGEFGLGCEMGISTQKLHARGPMGLDELCTYKYVVRGSGQIR